MTRIERRPLHDEVLERVREMVVEGRWRAGEQIPELKVAEDLGVSRTPLREALKVLASEGLVSLLPRRGAVVRSVTPDDARDMLVVIGALDALAGRLACSNATDAELDDIVAMHRRMMRYFEQNKRRPYFELNQRVHQAIINCAQNEVLAELHRSLAARIKRIRYAGSDRPDFWAEAAREHEVIVGALRNRDADSLAKALDEHMHNTWRRIRPAVEAESHELRPPISRL